MNLDNFKPFLKGIRAALYRATKKISFYLLKKLDSEFEFSLIAMNRSSRYEKKSELYVNQLVSVQSTIVINSNQAIVNQEVLDFYLKGIFSDNEIFHYVKITCCQNMLGLSLDEVEKKLEAEIIQNFHQKKDIFSSSICLAFFHHKASTIENVRAYSTIDRVNPNAVFWPNPTDSKNKRSLYTESLFARTIPLIDKNTRIVSAGSCFAMEIAHSLQKNGYNYLIKEENKGVSGSYEYLDSGELPNSSAAWGIIFNTPSFRQLVEKAFEVRNLPRILWTQEHSGKLRYLDPFRENIAFDSIDAYDANYQVHIKATREALLEMEVFIITLGLNEIWYFKSDGAVLSRSPWRVAPSLVGHKFLTVEENVNDLLLMAQILRSHNQNVSIICTLSPVPLHATFRGDDNHIITANFHSKAILRVAAEEFAMRCKNVYYFPSYEVVTASTEHPWTEDQRHVSSDAVSKVMSLFHQTFSKSIEK